MRMTAAELCKNPLQALERANQGECVEINYYGQNFQLVPEQKQTKLSRLVKRDTLNCFPDQLENVLNKVNEELIAEWEREWS